MLLPVLSNRPPKASSPWWEQELAPSLPHMVRAGYITLSRPTNSDSNVAFGDRWTIDDIVEDLAPSTGIQPMHAVLPVQREPSSCGKLEPNSNWESINMPHVDLLFGFQWWHSLCHWEVSFGAWKVAAKYLESLKTSVTMGSHCSQVLRTVILQELPGTSPTTTSIGNSISISESINNDIAISATLVYKLCVFDSSTSTLQSWYHQ